MKSKGRIFLGVLSLRSDVLGGDLVRLVIE